MVPRPRGCLVSNLHFELKSFLICFLLLLSRCHSDWISFNRFPRSSQQPPRSLNYRHFAKYVAIQDAPVQCWLAHFILGHQDVQGSIHPSKATMRQQARLPSKEVVVNSATPDPLTAERPIELTLTDRFPR